MHVFKFIGEQGKPAKLKYVYLNDLFQLSLSIPATTEMYGDQVKWIEYDIDTWADYLLK